MIKGAQSSLVSRPFQCCTPGFQRATFKGREWPRNEAILREGGNVITLDLQMTLIRVTKFSSLELFYMENLCMKRGHSSHMKSSKVVSIVFANDVTSSHF